MNSRTTGAVWTGPDARGFSRRGPWNHECMNDERRDRFMTLLAIYDLHRAPIERLGDAVRRQHDPAVSALKQRCEEQWLAELDALELPEDIDGCDPLDAMRALAARDRLPRVYKWLAREADWSQV